MCNIWGTGKQFYEVIVLFSIFLTSPGKFKFFHLLINTYCLTFGYVILVEVKWYFIVVLIFIFLISNDVEYLFTWSISQGKKKIWYCFNVLRIISPCSKPDFLSCFKEKKPSPFYVILPKSGITIILNKVILMIYKA